MLKVVIKNGTKLFATASIPNINPKEIKRIKSTEFLILLQISSYAFFSNKYESLAPIIVFIATKDIVLAIPIILFACS